MKILIVNGPNLNMLGSREVGIYGTLTYGQMAEILHKFCVDNKIEVEFMQSNCEGEIIDAIHKFAAFGIVINAGAYTHYSYAIADALNCVKCKKIEVHMSNVYAREEFRHKSVLSAVCDGSIIGFGVDSYKLAILQMKNLFEGENKNRGV